MRFYRKIGFERFHSADMYTLQCTLVTSPPENSKRTRLTVREWGQVSPLLLLQRWLIECLNLHQIWHFIYSPNLMEIHKLKKKRHQMLEWFRSRVAKHKSKVEKSLRKENALLAPLCSYKESRSERSLKWREQSDAQGASRKQKLQEQSGDGRQGLGVTSSGSAVKLAERSVEWSQFQGSATPRRRYHYRGLAEDAQLPGRRLIARADTRGHFLRTHFQTQEAESSNGQLKPTQAEVTAHRPASAELEGGARRRSARVSQSRAFAV